MFGVLIAVGLVGVVACNHTAAYPEMEGEKFRSRQNKLLSFNTQTNGDINMELAFNVPFISIPVRKTLDSAHNAVANLNVGAVILAGAIALAFAFVIPGVAFLLTKKIKPTFRSDGDSWILAAVEEALARNNVDSTSCLQRVACWGVKGAAKRVRGGVGSSGDKILDGVAGSKILQSFIAGTVLEEAVRGGLEGVNCSQVYHQCKITQEGVQRFFNSL